MTYIIHYITALTFGILGLQMQNPKQMDCLDTLSKISEKIDSNARTEKCQLNKDTFLFYKDFRLDIKSILTTNRAE
ncbi:MAG TPA: hypothetical protein VKX30_07860 [Flavobacteriaceae bacterium]|nr:hypothetical protein [Flavobacteriaceae bacterium]